MDTCGSEWTTATRRVFVFLCRRSGEKLSQRDIAKRLGLSPTTVGEALKELGPLVKKEPVKNINLVSLDQRNARAVALKRVENLRQLTCSGLVEELEQRLPGATVILFGSYARGEDDTQSDIDLAVIGRAPTTIKLERFENLLERPLSLHWFSSWKRPSAELRNNILNGIVLLGGVRL